MKTEKRDIVIKLQVDPIRYDPDEFLRTFPYVNPGGVLLGSFAEQGRATTMGKNEGHPDLVVDEKRYTGPEATDVFEFRSAMGNRYIQFTVRRTRTYQRKNYMNAPNIGNVRGQQLPYAVAATQLAIEHNESLGAESLDLVQYGVCHLVRDQNHF